MAEPITGVDVSGHNGDVDFARVRAAGHRFAFIKATEGMTYRFGRFVELRRAARDTGVLAGAYHYGVPGRDPGDAEQEAEAFAAVVQRVEPGELPPVLDLESNKAGLAPDALVAWAEAFLARVEERLGRTPLFYTYTSFWRSALGRTTRLGRYPLWQAEYSGKASPSPLAGWPRWTFWQYTSAGRIKGLGGRFDVNRFNGSLADLERLARVSAPTAPEEPAQPPPAPERLPLPRLDLAAAIGRHSELVERLQGLLLAHGYGPEGLVTREGFPDGIVGPITRAALDHFKSHYGLSADGVVDEATWRALVSAGL